MSWIARLDTARVVIAAAILPADIRELLKKALDHEIERLKLIEQWQRQHAATPNPRVMVLADEPPGGRNVSDH